MKTVSMAACICLFLPSLLGAQPGVPKDAQFALLRIEQAFRSGSPGAIEDLLPSSMTLRLGDELYKNVSRIKALDLLTSFFSDKKEIDFRFVTPGSGRMIYSQEETRDTTNVDVWLSRGRGVQMYALNISNYPEATVFLEVPASLR